jgi:two-component system, LytTR family, response regulator
MENDPEQHGRAMLKVVIIDDEPGAVMALRSMVAGTELPVRVIGEAHTALEGIKLIQRARPDMVLLDIEMPHGSGFDLLEAFPERTFQVVYTTAHEQHAVRAAHTHPYDYLLKPVDPDDLKRVLSEWVSRAGHDVPKRIEISSVQGKVFLRVYTSNGEKHVASKSIGHFEELLPKEMFFRCHHSHLVSLSYVKGYLNQDGGMALLRDGYVVPVASRRSVAFLERFEDLS